MKLFRQVVLLVGLAGATLGGAAPAAPPLDPKRIINDSYGFLKNQEPDMAADEYALYEKAVSLIAVRPEFGLKLLENLVASGEHKSPAFLLALGNVYYTNNKPELAETYFRRAIAAYPDFQRAWNNLAALLYAQGRYAEAIPCFTRVVAGGKADAGTLGVLAYCQARAGNPVAAEMNYVQALGLDPDNPDWLSGLLSLTLDAKQYGRAELLLKQLLRLKPQEAHNWVLYASVLHNDGRTLDAIALLDSAVTLGYASTDALLLLGDLCTDQKLNREAIDAYQRAMAQSPDIGAKRLVMYAQTLVAFEQYDAAERALAAVRGELSTDLQVATLQVRSDLAAARHDWTAAQKYLEDLLKIQPLDGHALLSLGRVYKAQDNPAAADLVLEQTARMPAFAYRSYLELADTAVKSHHYNRGIEYLEKALAIEKSPLLQNYIARLRLAAPEAATAP